VVRGPLHISGEKGKSHLTKRGVKKQKKNWDNPKEFRVNEGEKPGRLTGPLKNTSRESVEKSQGKHSDTNLPSGFEGEKKGGEKSQRKNVEHLEEGKENLSPSLQEGSRGGGGPLPTWK